MLRIKYILSHPFKIFEIAIIRLPFFRFIRETSNYQCPVSLGFWIRQKVLNIGGNRKCYWPVNTTSKIVGPENIYVGIDSCPGYMGGCYIQGIGKIFIDDYTQIAANVVIVSANHDSYDTRKHILSEVKIGKYCWLGAGAMIMPGVVLGDFSVVGAGAIVTHSFPDGHCVIAGNPARLIKKLDIEKCVRYEYEHKYNGYLSGNEFDMYRKKKLNI
jgi:acetyltransferase-like isoleucine patch superfamily enzyme